MHQYFYRTYLLTLPSSLVASPLTDISDISAFIFSSLFYEPLATSLSSIMQIILVPQIFFHFFPSLLFLTTCPPLSFCLSQGFTPVSVTHLPCLVPILTKEKFHIPLFFPLFPSLSCHLANKSLSDLSVNMPNWGDEYGRHSVYSWAENINWCDQLAVYLICRKLQSYLGYWSAVVLPIPSLSHYFQAERNVINMMS